MINDDSERKRAQIAGPRYRRAQHQRRSVVEQRSCGVGICERCVLPELSHVNNIDSRFLDQEAYINAAHVVAFNQVCHVIRVRQSVNRHRIAVDFRRDLLKRREVFHFFNPDDVRIVLNRSNDQRRLVETIVEGGRRQRRRARFSVVDRVEEALHVE